MGSVSMDTESRLYYAILHKGLGHLWTLVSAGTLRTDPPQILRAVYYCQRDRPGGACRAL